MSDDLQAKLAKLKQLHEMELLTDDDFKEQKRALLAAALGTTTSGASVTPLSGATTVGGSTPTPAPSKPLSGATTVGGSTPTPAPSKPLSGATTVTGASPTPVPAAPLSGATTVEPASAPALSGPTRGLTIMGQVATAASTDITTLPLPPTVSTVVEWRGMGKMPLVFPIRFAAGQRFGPVAHVVNPRRYR